MAETSSYLLSKSECQQIISAKLGNPQFEILTFNQKPFGKIIGFLGDHSTLVIAIKFNGKQENHSFFVKTLPSVTSQRNFAVDINGFFKEKFFYSKYISLLKQNSIKTLDGAVPVCYYTDGEKFVFEDLTLSGYTTLQSRTPLDLNCVKIGLKSIAKLHASGIILEEKKSFRLGDVFPEEFAEAFLSDKPSAEGFNKSTKRGFDAIIDLTHNSTMKISKEVFKEKMHKALDLQKLFVKPSTKYRNTICHSDLWTSNVMFKLEEPTNCVLVDFQSFRYCPPAHDVMLFLHLTTNREFRKKYMEEMLQFYYGEFDKLVGSYGFGGVISKEEFFESCEYYKQCALIQCCIHFQDVTLREDIANDLLSDPDRAWSVLFDDDRYDFVLDVCKKDDVYRSMLENAVSELREFYEN